MIARKKLASFFTGQNLSWALVDQLVVSAGNFSTNILLARTLSTEDYGTFVFFFGLAMFLGTLHNAIVIYPLSVIGPRLVGKTWLRHAGGSLILTTVLTLPMALVLLCVATLLGKPHFVLYAFPPLLLGQLQETLRRAFFTRLEFVKALPGDAVSYLGQAVIILVLASTGRLSLEVVFLIWSATSLAAFLLQLWQLKIKPVGRRPVLILGRRFIRLGRWMFFTNTVRVIPIQAVTWVLVAFHGTASAALVQAVFNLLNVMNPLIFSVQNLTLPAAARAYSTGGVRNARRLVWKQTLQGGLLLLPYYILLLGFPTFTLSIYYGSGSPYVSLGLALQIFTMFHILGYVTTAPALLLAALKQSKAVFFAEIPPTVALVVVAMPLAAVYGFFGAVAGSVLEGSSRLAANLFLAQRAAEAEE